MFVLRLGIDDSYGAYVKIFATDNSFVSVKDVLLKFAVRSSPRHHPFFN